MASGNVPVATSSSRFMGVLPNNTDLNTVTVPGVYLLDGENTYTNSPATYGQLECIAHSNSAVYCQRITTANKIYWRYATATSPYTWGSWAESISGAEVKYKIYNSTSDVGQTSGSATIAGVWAALPNNSIIICQASEFASGQTPNANGTVEMVRYTDTRGWINFYGKESGDADYRMYLGSGNTPTGTWVKEPGRLPECWTLLNAAGAGAGTVTTHLNRKISDYNVLLAAWMVNNSIRATATIWKNLLISYSPLSMFYVDSANVQRWCEISYRGDTSLYIACSQNASGYIYLYGLENT